MEEIDAESRSNCPTIVMLLPIDSERVEVVALEVHHRQKHVHDALAKPALSVLINCSQC